MTVGRTYFVDFSEGGMIYGISPKRVESIGPVGGLTVPGSSYLELVRNTTLSYQEETRQSIERFGLPQPEWYRLILPDLATATRTTQAKARNRLLNQIIQLYQLDETVPTIIGIERADKYLFFSTFWFYLSSRNGEIRTIFYKPVGEATSIHSLSGKPDLDNAYWLLSKKQMESLGERFSERPLTEEEAYSVLRELLSTSQGNPPISQHPDYKRLEQLAKNDVSRLMIEVKSEVLTFTKLVSDLFKGRADIGQEEYIAYLKRMALFSYAADKVVGKYADVICQRIVNKFEDHGVTVLDIGEGFYIIAHKPGSKTSAIDRSRKSWSFKGKCFSVVHFPRNPMTYFDRWSIDNLPSLIEVLRVIQENKGRVISFTDYEMPADIRT